MGEGAPPCLHQGEAAFALIALGAQQRVPGFRVSVELAAGWFLHRDEDSRAGPLVAGVGQEREFPQVQPGFRQDELAGGGQVMRAAGQPVRDP